MTSYVYYKFKAQKTESRIAFDGTSISVFDLKKEIILSNNLGKASDFDLLLYDASNKEYSDDSQQIPRSTTVIAKRMPPSKPGKGKAAMYIAGIAHAAASSSSSTAGGSAGGRPVVTPLAQTAWNNKPVGFISKRFDGREDKRGMRPATAQTPDGSMQEGSDAPKSEEEEQIAAMFQASDEHWQETQERMSHATPIYNSRGGAPRRSFPSSQPQAPVAESKPLPPGYLCHRCGKKGHWIQDCPTNEDREYDNRPRIKRTTGIPRSFLKTVEVTGEGTPQGVMVTPEGGFVIAQPDSVSWEKQRSRPAPLTPAEVRERQPSDPTLACPICNKLLRDAVQTPCCHKVFDEECIQTHLLERDFVCFSCRKPVSSINALITDDAMRDRVKKYISDEIAKSVAGPSEPSSSSQVSSIAGKDNLASDADSGSTSYANSGDPGSSSTTAEQDTNGEGTSRQAGNGGPSNGPDGPEDTEAIFDSQPGMPNQADLATAAFTTAANIEFIKNQIIQVQSTMERLVIMCNQPATIVPPAMKMQMQMQYQTLAVQMGNLNNMLMMASGNGNDGMMGGGNGGGMNGMSGMMDQNEMGMNAPGPIMMNGQNQQMLDQGGGMNAGFGQLPVFNNPGHPSHADSPYQRVAPVNRRRVLKRDRPEDFVDVNANRQKVSHV